MRVSSRQNTRNRLTGGGVAWIATTTSRPRTASRSIGLIQPRDGAGHLEADRRRRLRPSSPRPAQPRRGAPDRRPSVRASSASARRCSLSSRTSTSAPAARGNARHEEADRPASDDDAPSRPVGGRLAGRRATATAVGSTSAPTSGGRVRRQRDEHSAGNNPARLHRPRRVDAEEVQVVADVSMARAARWAVAAPVQRHDGDMIAHRPVGHARPRPRRSTRTSRVRAPSGSATRASIAPCKMWRSVPQIPV